MDSTTKDKHIPLSSKKARYDSKLETELNDTDIELEIKDNETSNTTLFSQNSKNLNKLLTVKEKKYRSTLKENQTKSNDDAMKKLITVSIICLIFMAIEVVGGIISGSLAILSDAAHMLSDFMGFAISMVSLIISKRKAHSKMTYGYKRSEVIGALGSVVLIWVLTLWLVYEGIDRIIQNKYEIMGGYMMIVAIVGLICNLMMGKVLHEGGHGHGFHGHSHGCGGDHGHSHSHGGSSNSDDLMLGK